MILTVTLNAAVDRTYRVEQFSLDRVHRPSEHLIVAGGKGINVARVYNALGGRAVATGFLGGHNGRFIARSLRQEGIATKFVRIRDESRVCIAIVDPVNFTQTEVNEAGPQIRPDEISELHAKISKLLASRSFKYLTLSGSIPPCMPHTIYAELIYLARQYGVRSVLDASGDALRHAVAALPWMVKPNRIEIEQLAGKSLPDRDSILRAAQRLIGTGIDLVAVTLGNSGAICATSDGILEAVPPKIDFVSAVGSGDSFLAAFLWAHEQGQGAAEALMLATGAGTANASVYGAGFITADQIAECASRASVKQLDA